MHQHVTDESKLSHRQSISDPWWRAWTCEGLGLGMVRKAGISLFGQRRALRPLMQLIVPMKFILRQSSSRESKPTYMRDYCLSSWKVTVAANLTYFITIVHACGRIKTLGVSLHWVSPFFSGVVLSVRFLLLLVFTLHVPQNLAFAFVCSNYIQPVTCGWCVWMTQRFREGAYSTNEAYTLSLHTLVYFGIIRRDFSTFKMRPSVLGIQEGFCLTAWFPFRCHMGES